MEFSYGELSFLKSFIFIIGGFLLIYLGSRLDILFLGIGAAILGGYLTGTGTLHLIPASILSRLVSSEWIAQIYWLFWLCVTLAIYSKEKLKRISDESQT